MNLLDESVISFFNQFAHCYMLIDHTIYLIANNKLFKGGVMVGVIWLIWFSKNRNQVNIRKHIVITILVSMVAIVVGKTLALMLPFRYRPIHDPDLEFQLPYGILETAESNNGILLSSMPSDHAVLYFALSTGILFMFKRVGVLALLYTIFFIAIPRIYLGLHYPSDILVGAILGITISLIGNLFFINNRMINVIMDLSEKKPGVFYAFFFLISYQIADLFTDSYQLVKSGIKLLYTFT